MNEVCFSIYCNGRKSDRIDISKVSLEQLLDEFYDEVIEELLVDSFEAAVKHLFDNSYDDVIESLLEIYYDEIKIALEESFEEELYDMYKYREVTPCGFFPEPKVFSPDWEEALRIFETKNRAEISMSFDKQEGELYSIDLYYYLENAAMCSCGTDDGDAISQRIGFITVDFLEAFLDKGSWHIGLQSEADKIVEDTSRWPVPRIIDQEIIWRDDSGKYKPIIWFGLDDEPPIPCWSLTQERNYPSALSSGNDKTYYNWDILYDGKGYHIEYWTVWECGMKGPSPQKVIESCPMNLSADDISEFVAKYQMG